MKEMTAVGQLWELVQGYLDRQPFHVSERQLAAKIGYSSSSTFDNWREPRSLPNAQALVRFAFLSGTPYQRVLDAALADAGFLPEPARTEGPLTSRRSASAPMPEPRERHVTLKVAVGDPVDAEDFLDSRSDKDLKTRRLLRGADPETGKRTQQPVAANDEDLDPLDEAEETERST